MDESLKENIWSFLLVAVLQLNSWEMGNFIIIFKLYDIIFKCGIRLYSKNLL